MARINVTTIMLHPVQPCKRQNPARSLLWCLVLTGIVLTGIALSQQASAEPRYRISIGSFGSLSNAENMMRQANLRFADSFSIVAAETPQGTLFRVLSQAFASPQAAESQLASIRQSFKDAWLLSVDTPLHSIANETPGARRPVPAIAPPQSRPGAAPATEPAAEDNCNSNGALVNCRGGAVALDMESGISGLSRETVMLQPTETLRIRHISEEQTVIKVDGRLDEVIWRELPAYDEFVALEPDTLERGPYATRVRFAYTDRGLYVGADLEQPKHLLVKRLSGRDVRQLNRDSINLTLDTSGEGLYGYWFGINLGDSLMDGTALPERQFSNEWDGPWYGASAETDTGWSAEFFIPWGTVTMPAGGDVRKMGVYMSRKVAHLDERWGWPALPDTQPKFLSVLQPIELHGVAPRQQYSLYPFSAVTADEIDDEIRYRVGADMFWRPSSNFQLNATVNPDFGSVESDDVVINLSATETFFPEKRLFFVEGQEIFVAGPRSDTRSNGVGQGGLPTTLVNTRRIGGKPQEPLLAGGQTVSNRELIQPVELIGAAKITGQIGSFRYGVLSAFEEDVKFDVVDNGQDINLHQNGTDYGIARLLYENNSTGAYKALGVLSTAVMHHDRDAFVTGIDWHYLTAGGKLKTEGQVFRSDVDGDDVGYGGFWDFEYNVRQGVRQRLGIEYFDEHVEINDLGFQARNDYMQIRTSHTRTSSNLSWARNNQFDIRGLLQENGDGYFTRGGVFIANRATFKNLTSVLFRLNHFFPGYDDLNSFGNGIYRIQEKTSASLDYESDSSGIFSYSLGAGFEEEDLGGDSFNYEFKLNWRPNDRFSLSAGARYVDRDGWLLHQEGTNFTTFLAEQWQPNVNIEYFINARQQFRISMQWVGIRAEEDEFYLIPASPGELVSTTKPPGFPDSFSISDMVFQARYRWEIAPLSDLFVVYTRASDLSRALRDSTFDDLMNDAWNDPIANQLVVKLRYRFGS